MRLKAARPLDWQKAYTSSHNRLQEVILLLTGMLRAPDQPQRSLFFR